MWTAVALTLSPHVGHLGTPQYFGAVHWPGLSGAADCASEGGGLNTEDMNNTQEQSVRIVSADARRWEMRTEYDMGGLLCMGKVRGSAASEIAGNFRVLLVSAPSKRFLQPSNPGPIESSVE